MTLGPLLGTTVSVNNLGGRGPLLPEAGTYGDEDGGRYIEYNDFGLREEGQPCPDASVSDCERQFSLRVRGLATSALDWDAASGLPRQSGCHVGWAVGVPFL